MLFRSVDLKARLAIELNRQIINSSGSEREVHRKNLKNLYKDKMTREQELQLLQAIIPVREAENRTKRDELVLAATEIQNVGDRLARRQKALEVLQANIKAKLPNFTSAGPARNKLIELESKIRRDEDYLARALVKKEKLDEGVSKLNEDIASSTTKEAQIAQYDQEILTTKGKEEKLINDEKIAMNARINPAAFEKSLAEQVAESNALFQGVFNRGISPHITLLFENIANYTDINQLCRGWHRKDSQSGSNNLSK